MSNFYSFDLAFDWNQPVTGGVDSHTDLNLYPLQIGMENVGVQPAYHFDPITDYVCFNAFDITTGAVQGGRVITGGWIEITEGDTSPFNMMQMKISFLGPSNTVGSNVFRPTACPGWRPVVPLLQLFTTGAYNFEVTLYVNQGNEVRAFFHDPEMIVGGTN